MDAIKVRTPQDFEWPTSALGRRKKYSSLACGQCRKRKIRCQCGDQTTDTPVHLRKPCKQCTNLGKECSWPEMGGRKRPRKNSDDTLKSSINAPAEFTGGQNDVQSSGLGQVPLGNGYDQGHSSSTDDVYSADRPSGHGMSSTDVDSSDVQESNGSTTKVEPEASFTTTQYYRHHGPTAIAPGHKKVSLKLRQECATYPQNQSDTCDEPHSHGTAFPGTIGDTSADARLPLFDEATSLPAKALLPELLDAFFQYHSDNFCFLNRAHLDQLIEREDASSFLICALSALASRFCPPEIFTPYFKPKPDGAERKRWEFAIPFLERAKTLLIPALSIPSCDVVAGLLFLSWADFGDNNEAGLWMFIGMAVRMAQDIGLHRKRSTMNFSFGHSPAMVGPGEEEIATPRTWSSSDCVTLEAFESSSQIVLFWSAFVQESCLASGTGRVPTIKRHEINVRPPDDTDMAIIRAGPGGHVEPVKPEVYPQLTRMMLLYAQSTDFLNTGSRQLQGQSLSEKSSCVDRAEEMKRTIIQEYLNLPPEIGFGAIFYQSAVKSGQGGPYLILHLFYHMHIAFLTQESLAGSEERPPEGSGPSTTEAHPKLAIRKVNEELYRNAIKSITDMLTFAKLIEEHALLSTFWINQPFFHAACAYIRDMLRHKKDYQAPSHDPDSSAFPLPSDVSPSVIFPFENSSQDANDLIANTDSTSAAESTRSYLTLIAKANYQFAKQSVKDMAKYYAGAGWVDAVLDQRETGLRDVDLSIVSEKISTFIRLHDLRTRNGPEKKNMKKGMSIPGRDAEPAQGNSNEPRDDYDDANWAELSSNFLFDAENMDLDPQALFDDYMFAEHANYNFGTL